MPRTRSDALDPALLRVFATVARAQGISRAATRLGVSKSVVSRSLTRLESALGTRLLRRTTRQLQLTDVGAQVLREADQIDGAVARIRELVSAHAGELRGRIRVSSPTAIGHL